MARVAKIMAHNVQQQDNVGSCQIIGCSGELWQSNNYGCLSIPLQVIATTIKNYVDIFHKIIKTSKHCLWAAVEILKVCNSPNSIC